MALCSLPARPAVAAVGVACVLLTACGGGSSCTGGRRGAAVALAPPRPATSAARYCAALARRLPARMGGQRRRAVRPPSPLTAAWGDPAITLRCGVPRPATLTPTTELTVVNGVAWFPQPPGAATPTLFTAVGRDAYVELAIPASYAPAGPILVAVSNAIAPAVPAKPGGGI
jgi:uncharacterized protein DUF3515